MAGRRHGPGGGNGEAADPAGSMRRIVAENRLPALAAVQEELERFSRAAAIPDRTRRALLLAVEELFTNTVRYGYDTDRADSIVIAVERAGDEVRVILRDHARAFDAATPDPAAAGRPAAGKVGGLGLFLVHELARSFTTRREKGANVTELRLAVKGG